MNINQLPEPPIKPTKLPKIVLDQDKEARFHSGQAPKYQHSTANPNPTPSRGGLLHQISSYVETQQTYAQKTAAQRTKQPSMPKLFAGSKSAGQNLSGKSSNSILTIIFLVVIFGGSAIYEGVSSIINEVNSDTSSDYDYDFDFDYSYSSGPDLSDSSKVEYEVAETSCIRMKVPIGSDFAQTDEAGSPCDISFDRGFILTGDAYSYSGGYLYENVEELILSRGFRLIETVEINGRMAHHVDDGSSFENHERYIFWVRDEQIPSDSDRVIETISLFLYGLDLGNPAESGQTDTVVSETMLESFEIIAQ